ncbi:MarR family winged helix-turn-helix transcriptional regulator [Actinoallomurus soli]|uniref:MarR family winged helix-turn-helix transcriptional regulator n=1 Tax=Actinoallomurus soli TaxID=2952535 RepID=UPI0020929C88|nr:MarR family winged helix-turn-helix transcriptional regulator [Actinoallomurus soli]MCO5970729.1 MarR family winged helix-turn-helix transcriptional regulator [Actinoallomurus soli]
MTSGTDPEDEAILDGIGPAFSRLRRRVPTSRRDGSRNLILNIVSAGDGEMTVGGVAEELGVDQSVASRMVSDCIAAGYLLRTASQEDGRRTVLEITPEGAAARDGFAKAQRKAFEQITGDWPVEERLQFARLLLRYVEDGARLRRQERDRLA